MRYHTSLPHLQEMITMLVDARFQDSWQVIQTASNIHEIILIPYPLKQDAPILALYPPLHKLSYRPLHLSTEMKSYIEQLPPVYLPSVFPNNTDILWSERVRFIEAYRQALIARTDKIDPTKAIRIEAPFLPMTESEYRYRVRWLVDHALTIPIFQIIDWWADLTCGVAVTSPTSSAINHLRAIHPATAFQSLNGWRQIGYIIELLER